MSRSFKMSNDVYAAMLARGFTGEMRAFSTFRMTGRDWCTYGRDGRGGRPPRRRHRRVPAMTAAGVPLEGRRAYVPPARGPLLVSGRPRRARRRRSRHRARRTGRAARGQRQRQVHAAEAARRHRGADRRRDAALGRDVAAVADGQDAFRFHREVGLVFQDPDVQLFSATVLDDVAFGPLQLGLVDRTKSKSPSTPPLTRWASRISPTARHSSSRAARRNAPRSRPSCRCGRMSCCSTSPPPRSIRGPQSVLVDLIRRMGEAGRTVVTATHDLEIVPVIADRVVVLGEERRVLADGRPRPSSAIVTSCFGRTSSTSTSTPTHRPGDGRAQPRARAWRRPPSRRRRGSARPSGRHRHVTAHSDAGGLPAAAPH